MINRREALGLLGLTASTAVAGCLFDGGPESGDLVIDNDSENPHIVEVEVKKISDNDDRAPHDYPPPTPEVTPEWTRTQEFEVAPSQRLVEKDFFTEPGAYYIECRLDSGAMAASWLGLYSAGRDGEEVAEELFTIRISEEGNVRISTPTND